MQCCQCISQRNRLHWGAPATFKDAGSMGLWIKADSITLLDSFS